MIGLRELLENVINDISNTITVKSITAISGGYRLNTCNTSFLRKGKIVNINSVDYIINDFRINEYVEILTTDVINITEFETYPIYFFSGTLKDTNLERNGKRQVEADFVPFTWFVEPYEQRDNETFTGSIATNIDLTFYVLDTCFPIGSSEGGSDLAWMTFDHHKQVIEPMQNWVENRLIPYIKYRVDLFDDLTDKVVAGLVFAMQSQNSTLFDENLSGVEIRITLPIYHDENCCVSTIFKTCSPVSIYENDIFREFVPSGGRFDYSTGGDATVQLNGVEVGTIPAGDTGNFPVIQDSLPVGSWNGTEWVVPNCPPSALNYYPTTKTGQTIQYGDFSDGLYQYGALVDFFTLPVNNPFGNTDRFTDLVGTQVYLEDIIIDWTSYNPANGSLEMMYVGDKTTRLWEDQKVFINSATVNGWNDWYMPNWNQVCRILYHGVNNINNYPPFNMPSLATSTTRSNNTAFYLSAAATIAFFAKASQASTSIYYRNGNISEL